MPEISTQVDFAPMWFETPDKPLKGGCSTNLEAGNDSKVPEDSSWTFNYRMKELNAQEKEIEDLKKTIASHKEGAEVFDLTCEIEALKEEAIVALNAETEMTETLSGLREELSDANAELKAYEEQVEGLEEGLQEPADAPLWHEEEVWDLRKVIVNMMSLNQAKKVLNGQGIKHGDCKKRGSWDTEDTVLERLWSNLGTKTHEGKIPWDEVVSATQ